MKGRQMQLHVVHAEDGRIIAISHVPDEVEENEIPIARSAPASAENEHLALIDLPDELRSHSLADIHKRFAIEGRGDHAALVERDQYS